MLHQLDYQPCPASGHCQLRRAPAREIVHWFREGIVSPELPEIRLEATTLASAALSDPVEISKARMTLMPPAVEPADPPMKLANSSITGIAAGQVA